MSKKDYDAVVVGSGPNGLSAAIAMQRAGLSVLVLERNNTIGGGMRTKELSPGFFHDICSAIHPLGASSFFFKKLPLAEYGLEWIYSPYELAHPFENGHTALLKRSLQETAETLGADGQAYLRLFQDITEEWDLYQKDILGPLRFPAHPVAMTKFGLKALPSAKSLVARFKDQYAKGIFAGLAAHAMLPLDTLTTSAIGLVLGIAAHRVGWPLPKGGSQKLADALHLYFLSIGGKTEVNFEVRNLGQLPSSDILIFDLTPEQVLRIAGEKFSEIYRWQLKRFKYGVGVFKVDFELSGAIPFKNKECSQAATVHLGSTYDRIAAAEAAPHHNIHSDDPFVLIAQQSLFDSSRTPSGFHNAWTYCHVPPGSVKDMTPIIENKIESFAPGFKDLIVAKHSLNSLQVQEYNPNYYRGDINGGRQDITQIFTRPALRFSPYKTSAKGIYICSSSTPPGGGVHGLCGYYAAKRAMKDIFRIRIND